MATQYEQTQRNYRDVETDVKYSLFINPQTHEYKLIITEKNEKYAIGTEANGFYICSCTPAEIKLNNNKVVKVNSGEFYNLKEGEKVTHHKFCGFKKFVKI